MILTRPLIIAATLFVSALAAALPAHASSEASPAIEVWKSPTCGCCQKWADYLTENGFTVSTKNTTQGMLNRIKAQAGIGPKLASCHTAQIDGYTIEGHVPAGDIKRLLEERPDAIGLAVPDMPLGSPGMEQPDGKTDPYEVLLVKKDGSTEVFAQH
ncbi:DUF411 domain-containing protein [Methyloceanibacter sp. wino2]|uniref:DUF411 domain-containing protein n=1 Tax=Methyloceanibacter sp. wino2 TaxID=2170729 RepID=UPI000D3E2A89|nr:DUF411 domain-containing protein [Methyloceanibacter sp. wino2]